MNLSKNFTFEELTDSDGHKNLVPINRKEGMVFVNNLTSLAVNILQPLREKIGGEIKVTSGFRGPSLNKAVGGSSTGAHPKGLAADIQCPTVSVDELFKIIKDNTSMFNGMLDKCIIEKIGSRRWIHISVAETKAKARNEFYTTNDGKSYTRVA